jgi:hypothetical protein
MITLLSAPLPIALSLADPSLPELVTLALVLLITLAMALILAAAVLAQTWAPTRLAHSLKHILVATVDSRLARKQQVTGISKIGLAPQLQQARRPYSTAIQPIEQPFRQATLQSLTVEATVNISASRTDYLSSRTEMYE